MRKPFLLGLAALGLALASGQEAKAWVNFKFSAGINWQWQSGDNTVLWGLFRNGQVPCPDGFGPHGYPPSTFPYFGSAAPVGPSTTSPTLATPAPAGPSATHTGWYGGNPYYTTGYTPSSSNYAYPSNYYGYNYSNS